MTTVTDIIEGTVRRDARGISHERVFLVTNLTGSGAGRLASALSASGIPAENAPHPTISGIREIATEVSPAQTDPSIARVVVTYGVPELGEEGGLESGSGQVSFESQMVTETTIEDIDGKRMTTEYAQLTSLTIITHEVEVDRPLFTARIQRRERKLDRNKIIRYTGAVNRSSWSSFPAKTWLCRISASQNTKGTYDYVYLFHYRKETWLADLTTKVDGTIPLNAVIGNGRSKRDVYPLEDFNRLGVKL